MAHRDPEERAGALLHPESPPGLPRCQATPGQLAEALRASKKGKGNRCGSCFGAVGVWKCPRSNSSALGCWKAAPVLLNTSIILAQCLKWPSSAPKNRVHLTHLLQKHRIVLIWGEGAGEGGGGWRPWTSGTLQPPALPSLQHGRMLGPPARKTKAEVLEGILMAMRDTSTVTSIPLGTCPPSHSLLFTSPQILGQDLSKKVPPELGGYWERRLACLLLPHPTSLSPSTSQNVAPGALAVGLWRRKRRADTAGGSGPYNWE